ncbi:MAG: Mov34/MPN/PAD-1 family protein [Polyangiales bacterium]
MGHAVGVVKDEKVNAMSDAKYPWMKQGVRVPSSVIAEIEAHAISASSQGLARSDGDGVEGEEACGVIEGPASDALLADEATRWPNLANKHHALDPESYPRTGKTYFLIDPLKFNRAMSAAEKGDRPIKVLYHSHLDCGAYFSETDAATALAGGDEPAYPLAFLVVSVRTDGHGRGGRVDDRRLFLWDAVTKTFVEGALVVA